MKKRFSKAYFINEHGNTVKMSQLTFSSPKITSYEINSTLLHYVLTREHANYSISTEQICGINIRSHTMEFLCTM